MSQKQDLRDAAMCKAFLVEQGFFDSQQPVREMMGAARHLQRRLGRNDQASLERCFFVNNHQSLLDINRRLEDIKTACTTSAVFIVCRCKVTDAQNNFTCLRHNVNTFGTGLCNGKIDNGTCKKCGEFGLTGEPDFLFNVNVMNCESDSHAENTFMVCATGGQSLFGRTAAEVHDMPSLQQAALFGAWTDYPIVIKGKVLYNPDSGYTSIFAYAFKKMPEVSLRTYSSPSGKRNLNSAFGDTQ